MSCLTNFEIPGVPCRQGKVRTVCDLGDKLLLVATDRISAFDWVLPTPIPDKGRVLNRLSEFWFKTLAIRNHLITTNVDEMPLPPGVDRKVLKGRAMLVLKTNVFPVECVVRGYLTGSGLKEYRESGTVSGLYLPRGLTEASKIPEPIFTPSTKAEVGHDVNITFEQMVEIVGEANAEKLRQLSLETYRRGSNWALQKGIIIADTKFEYGIHRDEIILIDEVLTPDSSRFWPADEYQEGSVQSSFDKQFVRDWLTQSGWDKNSPPPPLPDEVVQKTRQKYIEAYERLTNEKFE